MAAILGIDLGLSVRGTDVDTDTVRGCFGLPCLSLLCAQSFLRQPSFPFLTSLSHTLMCYMMLNKSHAAVTGMHIIANPAPKIAVRADGKSSCTLRTIPPALNSSQVPLI